MKDETTATQDERDLVRAMGSSILGIWAAQEVGDGWQCERKCLEAYRKKAEREYGRARAQDLYKLALETATEIEQGM